MLLCMYPAYWPCSKLSWELKQELRNEKSSGAMVLVLSVELPGGTKRFAFGPGVAASTGGQYDGVMTSVDSLVRAPSDTRSSMQTIEFGVEIADVSGEFEAVVTGANGHLIKDVAAVLTLGYTNLPERLWFEAFRGVLGKYVMPSAKRWSFSLSPNDRLLKSFFPKPFIWGPDWPNADPQVLAQYGPLLYGQHDSSTTTAKGAVPLLYVDKSATTGYRYLLCWGRAKSVDAVYSDGAKQASGWSVQYTEVGGRLCTLVKFTADQTDKAITADVQGYETVGDGSGTLIEDPTDVVRHLLTNWIYGDYKTGNWLTESTIIDRGSFEATKSFFRRFNAKAARRIFGSQRKAQDILNEWAKSWQMRMFWTNSGKIGARIEDYSSLALYKDDQTGRLRYDHNRFSANLAPEWDELIDRVTVDYHYQDAAAKYLYNVEVRDPSLTVEAPDNIQLPWSAVTTY